MSSTDKASFFVKVAHVWIYQSVQCVRAAANTLARVLEIKCRGLLECAQQFCAVLPIGMIQKMNWSAGVHAGRSSCDESVSAAPMGGRRIPRFKKTSQVDNFSLENVILTLEKISFCHHPSVLLPVFALFLLH